MASHSAGFDTALPTLEDFSMLLKCDCHTEWMNIGECLNIPETSLETISGNTDGFEDKDKRAFLLVFATWREKGAKRKESKKANWKNMKEALSDYSDLIKVIEELEKGWSGKEPNQRYDICRCGKPKALRMGGKGVARLFVVCPQSREQQCKRTYLHAEKFLDPYTLYAKPSSPTIKLVHLLREQKSKELVNFDSLSPHLMTQGLLTPFEYHDITGRTGYSPIKYFSAVVNEVLTKAGKDDVVKKFIQALRDEKDHAGHKDLLKIIESKLNVRRKRKSTSENDRTKRVKVDDVISD